MIRYILPLILLMPSSVFAVNSTATAEVLSQVSITELEQLSLGRFVVTGVGQVSSDGSSTPDVQVIAPGAPARFLVEGEDLSYSLIYANDITLTSGTDTIDVQLLGPKSGQILDGSDEIEIDGTGTVSADQEPGEYVGIYTVDVIYD